MRIYILNPIPFDGMGPSQTCLRLAEEMALAGHDVFLFGARNKIEIDKKIKFFSPFKAAGKYVPYRYTRKLINFWANFCLVKNIPQNSIVYAWPSVQYQTLDKLKEKGCKIFLETINLHTLAEKKIIEDEMRIENFFYEHYVTKDKIENQINSHEISDHIFVSNEHALDSVISAGTRKEKVFLTRYGGDDPWVSSKNKNQASTIYNNFVFIFVGRINLEKGVHKLLRAWRLAGIDAELHLYGNADKNMVEKYRYLFQQKGVKLMGYTRDIDKVYSSSDAFIFLSLAEGGPQVTIEAAFHKLPMIVSSRSGGRIARENETALVVDPDNTDATAQAIRKIFQEKALRERLGNTAYNLAKKNFSWKVAAAERIEFFRE